MLMNDYITLIKEKRTFIFLIIQQINNFNLKKLEKKKHKYENNFPKIY